MTDSTSNSIAADGLIVEDDTFYACCLGCRTTVTQSRLRERCPICRRIINPKGEQ